MPGFVVKKGMRVEMPIYASHYNPEYFPNPEEFQPERFLKENSENIIPYTFRPFGGRFLVHSFFDLFFYTSSWVCM